MMWSGFRRWSRDGLETYPTGRVLRSRPERIERRLSVWYCVHP